MFLVDSGQAASDWDGIVGLIETILKKADAEVVCLRKWSDRKLAYEIGHKSRGTYILCYFKADGRKITSYAPPDLWMVRSPALSVTSACPSGSCDR